MSNTARHAHARHVLVDLSTPATGVLLRILDDGTSIDPGTRTSGTANMATRAERFGGTCSIGRRDDDTSGTELRWRIPLPGEHRRTR